MQTQTHRQGGRTSSKQTNSIDPTVTIAARTTSVGADGRGGASTQMQKESSNAIIALLCAIFQRRYGFTEAAISRLSEIVQRAQQQFLTENVSVTRGNLITVPVISQKLLSSLQSLSLNGDEAQFDETFWQIQDRDQTTYRNGPVYFIHDVAITTTPQAKDISESSQQRLDSFEETGRSGLTVRELSTAICVFAASGVEGAKTTTSTTFVAAGSMWGNRSGTPTLTGSALERISTDQPIDSSYCVPSYGHSSGDY